MHLQLVDRAARAGARVGAVGLAVGVGLAALSAPAAASTSPPATIFASASTSPAAATPPGLSTVTPDYYARAQQVRADICQPGVRYPLGLGACQPGRPVVSTANKFAGYCALRAITVGPGGSYPRTCPARLNQVSVLAKRGALTTRRGMVYDIATARFGADPALPGTSQPFPAPTPAPVAAKVVKAGARWLGTPYSWGAGSVYGPTRGICCSPSGRDSRGVVGFDCSAFTRIAWFWGGGRLLPRSSRSQRAVTTRIPASQARPGDLIFWHRGSTALTSNVHHVGLVVGPGATLEESGSANRVAWRTRNFFAADVSFGRVR